MLFTVVQYFPSLEEETPGHRVEMAKKMKQTEPSDGDGDNTDGDDNDDTESDFDYFFSSNYTYFFTSQKVAFSPGNFLYRHLACNIHTPPPKI